MPCRSSRVGALLALKRPENPIGWLFLGFGLVASLNYPAEQYAGHVPHYAHMDVVASFAAHFWHPFFGLFVFAFLLFPDGHLVSPRWRWVAWVAAVDYVLLGLTSPLDTGYVGPDYPGAKALFSGPVSDADTIAHGLLLSFNLLLLPLAGASLIVRLRRSTGRRHEQVRLFAYTVAAVMLAFPVILLTTGGAYGVLLLPLIPISAGVAILRHRLFDLDIVINRALVYGALTVALGAVYLGLVLLIGLAVGRSGFAVAVSTLAVAALFRPARARIQGGVDRRFYRRRYDAARTLEAFGAADARRARPRDARRRPARRGRRHGPARARVAVAAEDAVNGEDALVTVLFVDIRDFTPFADRVHGARGGGAAERVLRRRGAGAGGARRARAGSSSATGCSACSARPSRCRTTPTAASPPRARSWRRSRRTSAIAAASASASTPAS